MSEREIDLSPTGVMSLLGERDRLEREVESLRGERDSIMEQFIKLVRTNEKHYGQCVQAHATIKKAKVALEELRDHQNGCPLPSYEKGWNKAMHLTGDALQAIKECGV